MICLYYNAIQAPRQILLDVIDRYYYRDLFVRCHCVLIVCFCLVPLSIFLGDCQRRAHIIGGRAIFKFHNFSSSTFSDLAN